MEALAAFVTVSVYVVVVVGETVTCKLLVTGPTPLSTLPVPLAKTAVKVVDAPAVIDAADRKSVV